MELPGDESFPDACPVQRDNQSRMNLSSLSEGAVRSMKGYPVQRSSALRPVALVGRVGRSPSRAAKERLARSRCWSPVP